MAAFQYIALDERGKQRKGVLEADSVRQIRQMLRDQGLVPLDVDVAAQRKSGTSQRASRLQFSRGLSGLDRVLITRHDRHRSRQGLYKFWFYNVCKGDGT